MPWILENSYSQLPKAFFAETQPTSVRSTKVILLNENLADQLGIGRETLKQPSTIQALAGNALLPGSKPLAQAYAGHQFGHFTRLGDGRALLLGEIKAPNGHTYDIQLKGSGPTPFSRRGDGRAALGPMLREYIISEAMAALGIPTTRSLAVIATGEPVYREQPLPGAVLTRVAESHIRVGTFQYAASLNDFDALKSLADFTIQRHYPEIPLNESRYLLFFKAVMERQADLVARWMGVGFIHGVMNTDNTALSGETIDYGPCAFLDAYDPQTVFSSIDRNGRYAFGQQPDIMLWNLARLAESLLPLMDRDPRQSLEKIEPLIQKFPDQFQERWMKIMGAKLGLINVRTEDLELIVRLLQMMKTHSADYTNTFRKLTEFADSTAPTNLTKPSDTSDPSNRTDPTDDATELTDLRIEALWADSHFQTWKIDWQMRLKEGADSERSQELMRRSNPLVIPRNHQVELALEAAVEHQDLSKAQKLLEVLSQPFLARESARPYRFPAPFNENYQTFCGT